MGGGLESRCVGRVYGADCAVRHHLITLAGKSSDFTDVAGSMYRLSYPDSTSNLVLREFPPYNVK